MSASYRLLHMRIGDLPVVFQGWIHNKLFSDRVTSQLPSELVLPSDLFVLGLGTENVVLEGLELLMIVFDELGNTLLEDGSGSKGTRWYDVCGLCCQCRGTEDDSSALHDRSR